MTPSLQELEQGKLGPQEVESFLANESIPIVRGRTVTFIYRGMVDEVRLRHWIHGLSSSTPFTRIEGTDLWTNELELPEGSRVEYKLEVSVHGNWRLIQDPLNPHLAHDPFGANSVVHAKGYEIPDWTPADCVANVYLQSWNLSENAMHPAFVTVAQGELHIAAGQSDVAVGARRGFRQGLLSYLLSVKARIELVP